MSNKISVDFDLNIYLTERGVDVVLDEDQHGFYSETTSKTWQEFEDELFGMNEIPYGDDERTVIPYFGNCQSGIDEIYEVIQGLQSAAISMRKRLEGCYVLDHKTWDGTPQNRMINTRRFRYDYLSLFGGIR